MNETINDPQTTGSGIELLPEGVNSLNTARKWSGFLAILGFIGCGFMLIAALFVGTIFSFLGNESLPPGLTVGITLLYLTLAVLYFFPVFYLYKFSDYSNKAVKSGNSDFLTSAIGSLKSHYKFIGIMAVVMLLLYPSIIMVAVLAGVISSM